MEWNKNEFLKEFAYLLQVAGSDVASSDVKLRYNALSKAIMAELYADWEASRQNEKRRCGYLSAEFLVGRTLFSNLLNLGILQDVRETLALQGVDINEFEEVEDAALGNGGLGRLAACFG